MSEARFTGWTDNMSAVKPAMIRLIAAVDAMYPNAQWGVNTHELSPDSWSSSGYGSSYCKGQSGHCGAFTAVSTVWDVVWVITSTYRIFDLEAVLSHCGENLFSFDWDESVYDFSFSADSASIREVSEQFVKDLST